MYTNFYSNPAQHTSMGNVLSNYSIILFFYSRSRPGGRSENPGAKNKLKAFQRKMLCLFPPHQIPPAPRPSNSLSLQSNSSCHSVPELQSNFQNCSVYIQIMAFKLSATYLFGIFRYFCFAKQAIIQTQNDSCCQSSDSKMTSIQLICNEKNIDKHEETK